MKTGHIVVLVLMEKCKCQCRNASALKEFTSALMTSNYNKMDMENLRDTDKTQKAFGQVKVINHSSILSQFNTTNRLCIDKYRHEINFIVKAKKTLYGIKTFVLYAYVVKHLNIQYSSFCRTSPAVMAKLVAYTTFSGLTLVDFLSRLLRRDSLLLWTPSFF